MRTIICSDAHGYPRLIEDALAAAGHRPGIDRFVYAGDLIDRGPDPVGCFELVDRLADVALFGNHDVACALGLDGPLWFRPLEDGLPLPGVRQVVGHTPIEFHEPGTEAVLATLGVYLTDPGAYRFDGSGDTGGHFRCAVIEDGEVEILTNDLSPRRPRELSLSCY